MDKYSEMMSAYVKIWLTASVINAAISTLIITSSFHAATFGIFFIILFFSYILSLPILVVAMLGAAIILSMQKRDNVFGTVLVVTLFSSIAGVIFFKSTLAITNDDSIPLGISIVTSALAAAIIVFRKRFIGETAIDE
jgi:hypothetical protein